jgi:hypothetical protein
MTRCDQMRKGELYGCDHCGFEFQVTKESHHYEGEAHGSCALDMVCCDDPLVLKGHGPGEPMGTSGGPYAEPVHGS